VETVSRRPVATPRSSRANALAAMGAFSRAGILVVPPQPDERTVVHERYIVEAIVDRLLAA